MQSVAHFLKKKICVAVLILQCCSVAWSSEPTVKIEPYTKDEIPNWAKDLRRTEIITFGSLPFVTLGVTLGYSFYRYFSHGMDSDYLLNPLAKNSSDSTLSTDEQVGIILSSAAISVLLGVTDLTINLIQRRSKEKKEARHEKGTVTIEAVPIDESNTIPSELDAEEASSAADCGDMLNDEVPD